MRVVYKYLIEIGRITEIQLPVNTELLRIGEQGRSVFMWTIQDSDARGGVTTRAFTIHGTGHHDIADDEEYVGTVQMPSGMVWHVFEKSI